MPTRIVTIRVSAVANPSTRALTPIAAERRDIGRRQGHDEPRRPERDEHAEETTGHGEQQGFRQELADQPAAIGPNRVPHGDFPDAGGRAGQEQVRGIRPRRSSAAARRLR